MDIFNKKALEKLEAENKKLKEEKDALIDKLAEVTTKFEVMGELKESEPADCKRGPWCKACEFVKTYHYSEYIPGGYMRPGFTTLRTAYMCGKGDSCKQFVQKETNNG